MLVKAKHVSATSQFGYLRTLPTRKTQAEAPLQHSTIAHQRVLMPAIYHHHHQVLSSEIDELQHANNAVYIHWMQAAAIAHSTAQGWPSQRYWDESWAWVARSHKIEYLQPAHEGDSLVVRTWVADMQRVSSLRRYEFTRPSDSMLIARAETRWAFINLATRKPLRIPVEVQNDFVIVPEGPTD